MTLQKTSKLDHVFEFSVPDFITYERTLKWFILFFVLFAGAITLSIRTHDLFLLIIIILGSVVFYQMTLTEPKNSPFKLAPDGVTYKKRVYPWNVFQSFSLYQRDNHAILHLEPLGNTIHEIVVPIPQTQHKEELIHILRSILPERLRPRASLSDWLTTCAKF